MTSEAGQNKNPRALRGTGETVIDAAGLSGPWSVLIIKDRLAKTSGPAEVHIINIDPLIRDDLVRVLGASGYSLSRTDRDAPADRLTVRKKSAPGRAVGPTPKNPNPRDPNI